MSDLGSLRAALVAFTFPLVRYVINNAGLHGHLRWRLSKQIEPLLEEMEEVAAEVFYEGLEDEFVRCFLQELDTLVERYHRHIVHSAVMCPELLAGDIEEVIEELGGFYEYDLEKRIEGFFKSRLNLVEDHVLEGMISEVIVSIALGFIDFAVDEFKENLEELIESQPELRGGSGILNRALSGNSA